MIEYKDKIKESDVDYLKTQLNYFKRFNPYSIVLVNKYPDSEVPSNKAKKFGEDLW